MTSRLRGDTRNCSVKSAICALDPVVGAPIGSGWAVASSCAVGCRRTGIGCGSPSSRWAFSSSHCRRTSPTRFSRAASRSTGVHRRDQAHGVQTAAGIPTTTDTSSATPTAVSRPCSQSATLIVASAAASPSTPPQNRGLPLPCSLHVLSPTPRWPVRRMCGARSQRRRRRTAGPLVSPPLGARRPGTRRAVVRNGCASGVRRSRSPGTSTPVRGCGLRPQPRRPPAIVTVTKLRPDTWTRPALLFTAQAVTCVNWGRFACR